MVPTACSTETHRCFSVFDFLLCYLTLSQLILFIAWDDSFINEYVAVSGVRIGRGNQSTQRTHLPQCCPLQNPLDMGSNPGLRGGKPTTDPFCFYLFIHLPISSRPGIAQSVQGPGISRSWGSIPGRGKRYFSWP
jgi:hypothetical protein